MNTLITISREFGSGGRELGRRLSELLNIAYYDQEIITEISRRTDLAERYIEQVIEQKPIPAFPLHIGRSLYPLSNPIYEQRQAVMLEQNRIIREMAKRSSCVIVGRCGDHILEDVRPFRIFVYAELEHRIARCMERRTAEEVYSLEEMKQKVISVDKKPAEILRILYREEMGRPVKLRSLRQYQQTRDKGNCAGPQLFYFVGINDTSKERSKMIRAVAFSMTSLL